MTKNAYLTERKVTYVNFSHSFYHQSSGSCIFKWLFLLFLGSSFFYQLWVKDPKTCGSDSHSYLGLNGLVWRSRLFLTVWPRVKLNIFFLFVKYTYTLSCLASAVFTCSSTQGSFSSTCSSLTGIMAFTKKKKDLCLP